MLVFLYSTLEQSLNIVYMISKRRSVEEMRGSVYG